MDELQAKLLEYLNGAERLISENGPKAYEATVSLVHLNAVLTLLTGLVWLAVTIAWFVGVEKLAKKLEADDCEAPIMVWCFGGIIGAAAGVVPALAHLFSKSAWIGIINPELGLLWEVYQKFIG